MTTILVKMTEKASIQTAQPSRRFRGQSAEQRRARRREQLIEAGLEAFGAQGFHSVGVRDICAAARLTERYFYESFRNREALFLAVYDEAVRRMHSAIASAFAASAHAPSELARACVHAFLETLQHEPRLARVLLIDSLTVSADVGDQSRLAIQSFSELTLQVLDSQFPDLAQHGLNAQLLSTGLVGSTLSIAMQWAIGGFKQPLSHVLDQCTVFYDSVLEALVHTTSELPR